MSYFAIERNGSTWDHVAIKDNDGNLVFSHYLDMDYNTMKSQEDLEDFVVAIMEATNVEVENFDEQTIVTLIDEDDNYIDLSIQFYLYD